MRFFSASSEIFNELRSSIMTEYNMPNQFAADPWPENSDTLALTDREYTPPDFAARISTALDMGAKEITELEYHDIMRSKTPQPIENEN